MHDVSPTRATPDVLIVGAGPVGLALANDLRRRGISFRLIDSAQHAAQQAKALGIQARTLELFAKMGVARTAIERGLTTSLLSIYGEGKRLIRIDFGEHLLGSPYPSVTQDEQGVEAVLRHAAGPEERIRVGFVVGRDGAHSTVRHLLGLQLAGTTFEQSFAVGNVRLAWDLSYEEIFAFLHQGNFIGYFPMADGRHRVVIAYALSPITVDQRDHRGALRAGDRAPNALVRTGAGAEPQPLFEIFTSQRSILLVLAAQQEAAAVERHWSEIAALLSGGYQEMIETYLVTRKATSESEEEARQILDDFTGELHQRYEAEQGGVVLVRPDGYIGFWGPFGATELLRGYVQALFVPGDGAQPQHQPRPLPGGGEPHPN